MISKPFPLKFLDSKKTRDGRTTDGRTHGRTDPRTDRPSYRDAWTHLKSLSTNPGDQLREKQTESTGKQKRNRGSNNDQRSALSWRRGKMPLIKDGGTWAHAYAHQRTLARVYAYLKTIVNWHAL